MRVNLVSIEEGLIAIGFRKLASIVKSIHSDTEINYLPFENNYSPIRYLMGERGFQRQKLLEKDIIREIAELLARADIIGFSSMSHQADLTRRVIQEVKLLNPHAFVIWGGIHPIVYPEDAILSADAICTGEGEYSIEEFLFLFKEGKDFTKTHNFWFNQDGKIKRNKFRPLNTPKDMNAFPFPNYGEDEKIYKRGKGFVPISVSDYLKFDGLGYKTIWSIGCPYKCTYCSNTTFIDNDSNYRKLRFPSVRYIVDEIKNVLRIHPHISTVVFIDDSFMAIPKATLREFSDLWKKEVNIPFCVMGFIPSFLQQEKMEILVEAGMNRLRMGIQSGSNRILKFYERPYKPGLIQKTTSTIAKFSDYIIPPAYDFIVDNPIETRQDIVDSLELIYSLKRPFTLNVFSLIVIPNTEMERRIKEMCLHFDEAKSHITYNAPTMANITFFLLAILKLPRWLFDKLLIRAKPFTEKQIEYPILLLLVRALYLVKRTVDHVRVLDFSIIPGRFWWYLWKLGIIKLWQKKIIQRKLQRFSFQLEKEKSAKTVNTRYLQSSSKSMNLQ